MRGVKVLLHDTGVVIDPANKQWDELSLGELEPLINKMMATLLSAERNLVLCYWHTGLMLSCARKQHEHGTWKKYLKDKGWAYHRVNKAITIHERYATPNLLPATVEEALGHKPSEDITDYEVSAIDPAPVEPTAGETYEMYDGRVVYYGRILYGSHHRNYTWDGHTIQLERPDEETVNRVSTTKIDPPTHPEARLRALEPPEETEEEETQDDQPVVGNHLRLHGGRRAAVETPAWADPDEPEPDIYEVEYIIRGRMVVSGDREAAQQEAEDTLQRWLLPDATLEVVSVTKVEPETAGAVNWREEGF